MNSEELRRLAERQYALGGEAQELAEEALEVLQELTEARAVIERAKAVGTGLRSTKADVLRELEPYAMPTADLCSIQHSHGGQQYAPLHQHPPVRTVSQMSPPPASPRYCHCDGPSHRYDPKWCIKPKFD